MINKQATARLFDAFHDIRFAAASLAYSTLISLIPFIIIVLSVFQSVGGLEEYYPKTERIFLSYLRETTGYSVSKFVKTSLQNVDYKTLGITGAIALLWTSLGLIRNIDFAFNKIWGIKINKPIYKRIWLYWLIMVAVPLGLALFVGLKSMLFLNQSVRTTEHKLMLSIWTTVFIFTLYKVIPATKVNWLPAIISSLLAGIALFAVQKSFLWISLKVFTQNQIYGSLASFPIFLLWLLIVWYVVLAGVALCAFLQQKSAKKP